MNKATKIFFELSSEEKRLKKLLDETTRITEKYKKCLKTCKNNSDKYKICLYDETSPIYTIKTIKIDEYVCSEYKTYDEIIKFNEYIENGETKKFPEGVYGLIPNYMYNVENSDKFELDNINYYHSDTINGQYYLIDVKIPFTM